MRRFTFTLVAAVSTIALTQIASAADLRRPVYKAPPPSPAPVYSWTGFYVGGNIGYSWGNAATDITGNGTATLFPGLNGLVPTFPGFISNFGFADSNNTRLTGVIGGGQIGFNYQFSPAWVAGIETDIQASGERGSSTFIDGFSTTVCGVFQLINPGQQISCINPLLLRGTAATAYDAKIDWFGTVRGRLGFLATPEVLLYATGGLAYGRVEASGITDVSIAATFPGLPPVSTAFSASKTNVGFAVGGGIEGKAWLLPANWTWKLEYLYLDLGSIDSTSPPFTGPIPNGQGSFLTGHVTTHTHFTDNIVRVGLNYKFY